MVNVKKNVKLVSAAHFAKKAAVISMLLVQLLLENFALTAVAEVITDIAMLLRILLQPP